MLTFQFLPKLFLLFSDILPIPKISLDISLYIYLFILARENNVSFWLFFPSDLLENSGNPTALGTLEVNQFDDGLNCLIFTLPINLSSCFLLCYRTKQLRLTLAICTQWDLFVIMGFVFHNRVLPLIQQGWDVRMRRNCAVPEQRMWQYS